MNRKQIVEQINTHKNSINALESMLRHIDNPFYNLLGHRCYIGDCLGDRDNIITAESMTLDEFLELRKALLNLVSGCTIEWYSGGIVRLVAAPRSFIVTLPKWEVIK